MQVPDTRPPDTSNIRESRPPRAATGLAGLLVFVAFLDLFAQLPVMASFAMSVGAKEVMVGLIVASYSVTNLGGNMLAGQMLDRWGRRPSLFLGLAGAGLALFSYSLCRSPDQLLAVRLFHGFAAGLLTPSAFTILADLAPQKSRARAMGLAGSSVGIAAIAGPALSGILRARWGFHAVFFSVSGLMFLILVLSLLLSGHLLAATRRTHIQGIPFRMQRLVPPCTAVFILMATLGILTAYLPINLESHGYAKVIPGILFSLFSLAAVVVMASPLGRLSDRVGTSGAMLRGLPGVGAALLLLSISPLIVVLGLAMVLYGFSFGLIFPAANTAAAEAGGADRRGRAFAILYAVFSLGVIFGAAASGFAASFPAGGEVLPYYMGVALALAGAAALYRMSKVSHSN